MMRKIYFYLSCFLLFVAPLALNASANPLEEYENSILGNYWEEQDEQRLIKEGRKQLSELIAFNAKNDAQGCSENNVYFFSLSEEDDWIEYLRVNGDNSTSLVNGLDLVDLNAKLQEAATAGKPIFVCLVTSMPVEVGGFFELPNKITDIIRAYEQEGTASGDASAINVRAVRTKYNAILTHIFAGHDDLSSVTEYGTFINATPDKLLLSAVNIHATQLRPSKTNPSYENARVRIKKTAGYFKEYDDQLTSYISGYEATTNPLERDIKASVEFVLTQQHDPTKARDVIVLEDQTAISDFAHGSEQSNNQYTAIQVEGGETFVYDYAGVYNTDPNMKERLRLAIRDTFGIPGMKMKIFITDNDTNSTDKTAIDDLDMGLPVHVNTIVVWLDIKMDGKIESSFRYSPDLLIKVRDHLGKQTLKQALNSIISFTSENAAADATLVLDFVCKGIFITSSFLVELIDSTAIIPEKYYLVDHPEYNSTVSSMLNIMFPDINGAEYLFPAIEEHFYLQELVDPLTISSVTFAFSCGLWNGLMTEIKGILQLTSMASGYRIDAKKNEEVKEIGKLLTSGNLLSLCSTAFMQAHTGSRWKIAHQIGKDVIFAAVAVMPLVGMVQKFRFGTMSSVSEYCTTIATALDKINPLAYTFQAMGFVVKKGAGGVLIIGKQIGNDIVEAFKLTNQAGNQAANKILFHIDIYIESLRSLERDLGPLEELLLAARMKIPPNSGYQFALETVTSGLNHINMGTDEFVLFAKKSGEAIDRGKPFRIVKGAILDEFVEVLKVKFLEDLDDPLNIAKLFEEQAGIISAKADEISTKLAKLPHAQKLLDDVDIRNALKNLDVPQRKKFYEDLAEAADPSAVSGSHLGRNLEQLDVNLLNAWQIIDNGADLSLRRFRTDVSLLNLFKDDVIYANKISTYLSENPHTNSSFIEALKKSKNKGQFIDELEHQPLLIVGDGTFEYSRTLRDKMGDDGILGSKYDITASEVQTQAEVETLINNSSSIPPEYQNLPINSPNYTAHFEVDATNLVNHYPANSQNKIVFNNPRGNGNDIQASTDALINDVVMNSAHHVLKNGGELHVGITGSPNALGKNKLDDFLSMETIQIGNKQYSVRKIHRDATRYYEGYNARTTGGGWMRGSQGPTWYYIFRIKE